MTKIINLTPHAIRVIAGSTVCDPQTKHYRLVSETGRVTIPASGQVARVSQINADAGTVAIDGVTIPVETVTYGPIEGLPAAEDGTIYIVSAVVHAAAKAAGRTDTRCVTRTIFDEATHRPIGAMALAC